MTARIVPLVTEFDATGMLHTEVMLVANSYGWKSCSLQWTPTDDNPNRIIAKRLSERVIEERLRRYRDVTR